MLLVLKATTGLKKPLKLIRQLVAPRLKYHLLQVILVILMEQKQNIMYKFSLLNQLPLFMMLHLIRKEMSQIIQI